MHKEEAKKIAENVYELPKKGRMLVPGIIFASDLLFSKIDEESLTQLANMSSLEGIVKNAIALSDVHRGYGFCIGGVAAFDTEKGIISPGGVGYDVNCLHPDTKVHSLNGYWLKIKDVEGWFDSISFDVKSSSKINTKPVLFIKKAEKGGLLKITTEFGNEIIVTHDHPLLTKVGMILAKDLKKGSEIVVNGFRGVQYKKPEKFVLINEQVLKTTIDKLKISDFGNAKKQILNFLKKRNFLYIDTADERIPILLKLLGFVYGGGTIQTGGTTAYYGKPEDLAKVKEDIERLGFKCNIFKRKRHAKIKTNYGFREFDNLEYSLHIPSESFGIILASLGAPTGKKTVQEYRIPRWIMNSENWQKRLFLASYFGAEMSIPDSFNGHNFHMPSFSASKLVTLSNNTIEFLNDIKYMLNCLSVECAKPKIVDGYRYDGKDGQTIGFRLSILSNTANLIKFFTTVGFEYNKQKGHQASLAALYLRYLQDIREQTKTLAIALHSNGFGTNEIIEKTENRYVSEGFIKHAMWDNRGKSRIWNIIKFDEFCNKFSIADGFAYDAISEIEELGYSGYVYDLTINDINHNFVANGMVVSNCGVRLIKTDIKKEEILRERKNILDEIYKNVPSGVGEESEFRLNEKDLDEVLNLGLDWALKKGLATQEDIEMTEDRGCITGANALKVSQKAKSRGKNQLGTIGAGNHFIEIQELQQVFDKEAAKAMGLEQNQIVVMLHTGSRGLGHQVASDYIQLMEREYGFENLPDRELICAPINSKLGQDYRAAMAAAANFAFTNRQLITYQIRKSFAEFFPSAKLQLLYDVAHNIAKFETFTIDGKETTLCVHRKGATRSFGPGRAEIPEKYRKIGQPILIPGSMGTFSYVLVGTKKAEEVSFASTAHGAGRLLSRTYAINHLSIDKLNREMQERDILMRVGSRKGALEEAPEAYKDINEVVRVSHEVGIGNLVAKLKPLAVVKG